jgi:hypothetical protein
MTVKQPIDIESHAKVDPSSDPGPPEGSLFSAGVIMGLLVGEGHFGGDGKQPHVTLRMHIRHESLFRWLVEHVPGSKLYGPYNHSGRQYYQWMARGEVLKKALLPLLDTLPLAQIDHYTYERYQQMKERYKLGENKL